MQMYQREYVHVHEIPYSREKKTYTIHFSTRFLSICDTAKEDADEPLQGVLVHGINIGQAGHTEEEDLGVDGHWDVLAASGVNLQFSLLSRCHFGLG